MSEQRERGGEAKQGLFTFNIKIHNCFPMQLLLVLKTTALYFCSSSLELPQKRSKRSRALSTTSTVAGFTMFRGATELGGELMSGKLGSSKQRNVDPGTGRSYCGFS